jgi:hypothetical protein
MINPERSLGRLEEFKAWAKSEFSDLRKNQLMIIAKLDRINQDRWIMYGKMTIINGILVLLIELATHIFFN